MTFQKPSVKLLSLFFLFLLTLCAGTVAVAVLSETTALPSFYFAGFLRYFTMISVFLFGVIVCVDAYAMFAIKTSTYHTFLLALSIMVCSVLSPDVLSLLNVTPDVANSAAIILPQYAAYSFFIFMTMIFFDFSYSLKMSLRRKILYTIVCTFSFALFAALYFVKLQFLALIIMLIVLTDLSIYVYKNPCIKCFNSFSFPPTLFLSFTLSGLMAANITFSSWEVMSYPFGLTAFYLFAMTLTYAFVYFSFIRRTQQRDLMNAEYRARYEHERSKYLQTQIKPHFLFNVLSLIKNLYHMDRTSGDNAIDLFSKHLRAQVEAINTDIIPFEKELDNIQIFIDLENLRRERELNVIFDIEYTDFYVPPLSLQPFVENAIKYSDICDKEDGCIIISSRCDNEGVILSVSDNGAGFDVNAIPDSSYGIRNSTERFRLLTGIAPVIVSSPENGTQITIYFDKITLEKMNENNNR